jgi:hypothetical protein
LPAFATVSLGGFKLLLSGPGVLGSRPMPDGRRREAGGWNRIVLHVTDVAREIEGLEKAGLKFRNEMETGREADRFSSRIPMGIRSSSSSRHGRDQLLVAQQMGNGPHLVRRSEAWARVRRVPFVSGSIESRSTVCVTPALGAGGRWPGRRSLGEGGFESSRPDHFRVVHSGEMGDCEISVHR